MAIPEKKPYERLSDYLERSLPAELEAGKSRGKATADIISKFNEEPPREMFAPFIWGYANNASSGDDADADAYLAAVTTAGGTTDATIDAAVQTLFTDLKTAGVYSKIYAFYPYVGGTASSHIINANLNTSYDQVRSGGWTDNSFGAQPNGTNGWSNTQLLPSSVLTKNNTGLWTYLSGSGSNNYTTDIGTGTFGSTDPFLSLIWNENAPDQFHYLYAYDGSTSRIQIAATTGEGLFVNNRPSANIFNFWVNGIKEATDTDATTGELNTTLTIKVPAPQGSGINWASRIHMFDAITEGLSDTEVADFSTAINAFQTSLGRNVY